MITYVCNTCKKQFRTKAILDKHQAKDRPEGRHKGYDTHDTGNRNPFERTSYFDNFKLTDGAF